MTEKKKSESTKEGIHRRGLTRQNEKQVIYNHLKAYASKHSAQYYCAIITPQDEEDTASRLLGPSEWVIFEGEKGAIIDSVVKKTVLPTEKK